MDKLELKKIGILGGTFDPPHFAHLRIAEEVREAYYLDKVFFIPAGLPPHKKGYISSFEDRFQMVKLAIKDNEFFEVLDIEKEIIPSYTLKTLQKLKENFAKVEKFMIIGWDSFLEFETWWNYEKILDFTNVVVVPRRITSLDSAEKEFYNKVKTLFPEGLTSNKIFFFNTKTFDISSTFIRELCKQGRSIRYLVPERVYFYIQEKGLYK